jgi:septal ring factor EnvC (AmiA/AmiB activator)
MFLRRRTDRQRVQGRQKSGTRHPRRGVFITMLGAVALAAAALPLSSSASQSLGQLNSSLGATHAKVSSLTASVHTLDGMISTLGAEISGVQAREATVRQALVADETRLGAVQTELIRERGRLAMLKQRLARARMILSHQLVSQYEQGKPNLMTVVLDSSGFSDLLNRINYLGDAEHQQQQLISITRTAKAAATAAANRLVKLVAVDRQITGDELVHERALAGMNALLSGKQAALQHARAAQQAALGAEQARGAELQRAISKVEAQQAAAAAAASQPVSYGPALGPSGGWSIPYPIVLCESGGQNLPPNSAGASGYYQIIPSTWRLFDGTGPAAYLAPKSEQDAVAARIWNGGAGWSNWVCAHILGIH